VRTGNTLQSRGALHIHQGAFGQPRGSIGHMVLKAGLEDTENSREQLTPAEDLFCGAYAGAVARMCVAPLDVVKIRFQIQSDTPHLYQYTSSVSAIRNIVAKEGVTALWKGNMPALMMVVPYGSLQFAAFYQLRQSRMFELKEPYQSLAFGAVSGVFATACTYPFDLLRTVFAAQSEPRKYPTFGSAITGIYRKRGVQGLYAGFWPTLVEIVPYVAIAFASYEYARAEVTARRLGGVLSTLDSLVIGASTGTFAKLVTLPLDNAKKRLQVQGHFDAACGPSQRPYSGMIDCLARSYARDGIRSWFRGLSPSLIKAAPSSAITFAAYESAKGVVASRRARRAGNGDAEQKSGRLG
jgi:solute carrier family 25 (mitochondrial thiamine pyrophosphate transporter), member 19